MRYNGLTSDDGYHDVGPYYRIYFAKIHSQDLHHWVHFGNYTKWRYRKDASNHWWRYYTALHNPTSSGEKIVDIYDNWLIDVDYNQLWVYIMRYNGL